jgi:valyl-tRNA synthetase
MLSKEQLSEMSSTIFSQLSDETDHLHSELYKQMLTAITILNGIDYGIGLEDHLIERVPKIDWKNRAWQLSMIEAELVMEDCRSAVTRIRNFRTLLGIPEKEKLQLIAYTMFPHIVEMMRYSLNIMGHAEITEITDEPRENMISIRTPDVYFYIQLDRDNLNGKIGEIKSKITKLEIELKKQSDKLLNPQFLEKAPPDIIEKQYNIEQEIGEELKQYLELLKILLSG